VVAAPGVRDRQCSSEQAGRGGRTR
jgi:hypothetical protein